MSKDATSSPSRGPWSRVSVLGAAALLLGASAVNCFLFYSFQSASSATSASIGHASVRHVRAVASALNATQERDEALVAALVAALEDKRLVRAEPVGAAELPPPFQGAAADAPLGIEDDVHIVFSMSCEQGRRVLLQSVLQFSAAAVGQRGPITQILSGCSPEQQARILREEPALYHDFRRHFTPAFSPHPVPNVSDEYSPYNKPFGLRHFLRHADPPVTQRVVALVDGDTIFFRKLAVNTGADVTRYVRPIDGGEGEDGDGGDASRVVDDSVQDGVALAQDWLNYLGSPWFAPDRAELLTSLCAGDSACELALRSVSESEGRRHYAGPGPPYVMTRADADRMVDDYCGFLVRMRVHGKDWMTEMYAYVVAAARHGIRHKLLSNLGVTHPSQDGGGREDWGFLTAASGADPTETEAAEVAAMPNPCEDDEAVVLPAAPPVSVHYCQFYGFADGRGDAADFHALGHFFYKYAVPEDIMECGSALLRVPPASDWSELPTRGWTLQLEGRSDHDKAVALRRKYHELWFACSATKVLNQAALRYKRHTCPRGFNAFRGVDIERTDQDEG